jgi:hypothetical protein
LPCDRRTAGAALLACEHLCYDATIAINILVEKVEAK